jgi:hypothetical protein
MSDIRPLLVPHLRPLLAPHLQVQVLTEGCFLLSINVASNGAAANIKNKLALAPQHYLSFFFSSYRRQFLMLAEKGNKSK